MRLALSPWPTAGRQDEAAPAPVFLVGAARSGTSLLYKVMALHPEATWLSNWVQRYPRRPELAVLNQLARSAPARRSRVWFGKEGGNAYVYGDRRPHVDRMFPMPAEAESLYRACGIPEPGPGPERTAEVDVAALRVAFAAVAHRDRRSVVLSKRIANNRRIALLARAFPSARFIEIVRDGRAVAASLAKVDWWETDPVWWYGGTPAQWRASGGDPWELCARNWVEEVRAVREGLSALPADRVLSLTYEELVAEPAALLRQALHFSDLDPDEPRWGAALTALSFPRDSERWRSAFDDAELERVQACQREELLHYGYLT